MNNSQRQHAVHVARDEDVSPVVAQVKVALHANGAMSIAGPQDDVWTLAALENAADAVRARVKRTDESTKVVVPERDVAMPASLLVGAPPTTEW